MLQLNLYLTKPNKVNQMNNSDMPANVVTEEQWDRSSTAAPAIGLTKREHFAGLAMQGLLANNDYSGRLSQSLTKTSMLFADALLKELEK